MNALLRFLTSQRTTWTAVLLHLVVFFGDARVVELLQQLGLSDVYAEKIASLVELLTILLAALGFSPLKRPPAPDEGKPE